MVKRRRHEKNPGDEDSSWYVRFLEGIHDMFIESIPSEDIVELPTSFMYGAGLVVNICGWSMFMWFLYQGVMSSVTQKYLALDLDAGVCHYVLRPITGTFRADYMGYWEGDREFSYSRSKYTFILNKFTSSLDEWPAIISEVIANVIAPIGQLMAVHELPHNLLIWMAWSGNVVRDGIIQTFQFNGSPEVIFARHHHRGGVGNYFGDCPANSSANFDPTSGQFSLRFNYEQYMASSICVGALDPAVLGYDPLYDTDFVLSYDARSLAVAGIINHKLSDLQFLTRMGEQSESFEYEGMVIEVAYYYDSRFPGMTPIQCAALASTFTPLFCSIFINSVPAFPVFNHFGNHPNLPEMCSCDDGSGHSEACNAFDLLTGVVMFQESLLGDYRGMQGLLAKTGMNVSAISALAYNGQFAASTLGLVNTSFTDPAFRASAYDFCSIDGTNCSIVSINSYDEYHQVSEFYLELPHASCADTLHSDHFATMAQRPVAQLTEDYFQCSNDYADVVINSLGIATGMYSLVLPLLLLIVVSFARWAVDYQGARRKYGADQRADVLDSFALMLLMCCAGKLPEAGVLQDVADEMRDQVEASEGALDAIATQNGVHGLRASLGMRRRPTVSPSACKFSQSLKADPYAVIELGDVKKSGKRKSARVIKVAPMPVPPVAPVDTVEAPSVPASLRDRCELVDYVGEWAGTSSRGEQRLAFSAHLYRGAKGAAQFATLMLPTVTLQMQLGKTRKFELRLRPSTPPSDVYLPPVATNQIVCVAIGGDLLMCRLELNHRCELCIAVDASAVGAGVSDDSLEELTVCCTNVFYQCL